MKLNQLPDVDRIQGVVFVPGESWEECYVTLD
jgi:hypothetical protein